MRLATEHLTLAAADPKKELVDPALIGTTSILKAIHRSAPSVKRVVVTASFACIIDEAHLTDPYVYSEASWNPVTIDDIHRSPATAYRASKKLAEKAAWDFVAEQKPSFDLVTICPPLVLGPVVHHLADLKSINTSNERVVQLVQGQWREAIPPTGAAWLWIDVRDAARAHIRAIEAPEAGGKRLFTTAGYFCNEEIAHIVRKNFPEYSDRLPTAQTPGGNFPAEGEVYKFDTKETNAVLGIKWTTLEQSMVDLVKGLKAFDI
jgi:nucleoside-diphosphate-sugar epimerase